MSEQTTIITPSPRWTGTANVPCYVCEFCADSYDTAGGLRRHLAHDHPGVRILHEESIDSPAYINRMALALAILDND